MTHGSQPGGITTATRAHVEDGTRILGKQVMQPAVDSRGSQGLISRSDLYGIGVVPGDRVYHFRIVVLVVISVCRQQ